MLELLQNPYFLTALGLAILCIILLFVIMRKSRDVEELSQDLQKNILDYNQLVEKFDALSAVKSSQDLAVARFQTANNYLNEEIKERDLLLSKRSEELSETQEKLTALGQELTTFKITLSEKEKNFAEQQQAFLQSKQQLTIEFQNLANRILEEKSQSFSQSNQVALDALLKPFREQIDGFQKRVNEIHSENVKGNASLESEIKKVLDIGLSMSQQADNLTSALKGEKKTLGNWGEIQLERALQLAGLVKGEHYEPQAHFKDEQGKHNYPDFVVHLPDDKHLIIDSKMSLVAYESAVNSDEESQRNHWLKEHVKAIRNHINDLSQKDYSNLIGMRSPNFVLMFVAVEPAYIEAMKADIELFNYGYNKNVILVSHTTLMPILRTVANLWRIERGNAEAREISERAGEIYNQICLVAERLAKLGNTLSSANARYNDTVTALVGQQGLVGKVERFKDLSAKANKTLPAVELLHSDIETEKLLFVRKVENGTTDLNHARTGVADDE
ncbi:DNA recombination protein RmuC [Pasteurella langaaensis DSM 22999]|uniref:DNA recombination protein RmuC n=1 Tax=Alitibacter langaaensis DSM 22999 TaxID=1122935 RepID=A0A2U0SL70_9PAST|nr:DNA recombination protein RmuC [Pasteurella langaaensis]PVX32106.1 DNA recombination protein RmuC [Pasteurella langaaensis DSM 22999]